ncbi:hypothetical protein C2E31_02560 [Rhodopirellula baltica]|nr:hypothetical protein C2E31_02560 [Rhodopirellula baltica]
MKSQLEVLDASGSVLATDIANSVFDNDNELTISGITGQSELYIRVSPADTSDIYSVGDFFLEVDYRDAATRASDLLRSPYDSGADALFAGFDMADFESGQDDILANANALTSQPTLDSRYEFEASVSSANDVDYYKITAPSDVSGKLIVHLSAVGIDSPSLNMQVVDSTGTPVAPPGVYVPTAPSVSKSLRHKRLKITTYASVSTPVPASVLATTSRLPNSTTQPRRCTTFPMAPSMLTLINSFVGKRGNRNSFDSTLRASARTPVSPCVLLSTTHTHEKSNSWCKPILT